MCLWKTGFLEGNEEEDVMNKFCSKIFIRIEKLLPDQSQCGNQHMEHNFSSNVNIKYM